MNLLLDKRNCIFLHYDVVKCWIYSFVEMYQPPPLSWSKTPAGFSSPIPSPFVFNFLSLERRRPLRTELEHECDRVVAFGLRAIKSVRMFPPETGECGGDRFSTLAGRSDQTSHPVCSAWELRLHEGGESCCLLRLQEDVSDLDVPAEPTQEE